jgi:hypothetical protein
VNIAMTTLQRRIRKLEAYVAAHEVVVPDWAVVMRERKRRRAEAEGRTYVAPEPVIVDDPNDWAQVMRACRARRVAEWERAKEAELRRIAASAQLAGVSLDDAIIPAADRPDATTDGRQLI